MILIGILEIHEGFGEEKWFINNFSYTNLLNELKDYIKFSKISKIDDLFIELQKNGLTPDKMISIADIEYNENFVIQTFYAQGDKNDLTYNKLGSQIMRNADVIGTMVFIKRELSNTNQYINFETGDFIMLIQNVFVRNGLELNIDGECRNIEYINDLLESQIHADTFENIRYYEHKFLDYTLTFYVNKSESKNINNINRYASIIYGKKIYGKVYITLIDNKEDMPVTLNLSKDILMKIYHLCGCNIDIDRSVYTKKLSLDDLNINNYENGIITGFPNITLDPNFFSIICTEYNKHFDKKIIVDSNQLQDLKVE